MAFIFEVEDINTIKNEFQNVLSRVPKEFLGVPTEILRFKLFELIFLERCALY